MDVFVGALGVVSRTFVVWLTIDIMNRREKCAMWTAFAMALYVPGFGTAVRSAPRFPAFGSMTPSDPAGSKSSSRESAKIVTNSIGMELVLIPAGEFRMGSPTSEKDRSADEAPVEVTLTKGFYLSKTEVTQGQWRAVMGTTPWKGKEFVREGDSYAATYVSWEDAKAFCKKLNEKEKGEYRLPTEAEWEYACRGRKTTRFSFGDNQNALNDYAWWGGLVGGGNAKSEKYAHETGQKQPNRFGLYDMHGNVWEWCEDVYAEKLPGGTDPLVAGKGSFRVYRGGGWFNSAAYCRSAQRSKNLPSTRSDFLGFRVVRNVAR